MLADNFHRLVEKEMNEMKDVCDWRDFVKCIKECGNACEMEVSDFKDFVSELSQGKESKQTRPLLADVSVAEFRKGSTSFFYKESYANSEYKEAQFMKKIAQRKIMEKRYTYESPQEQKVWKVTALRSFWGQNFPSVKIGQAILKVDLKYVNFIFKCSTFYKFVQ